MKRTVLAWGLAGGAALLIILTLAAHWNGGGLAAEDAGECEGLERGAKLQCWQNATESLVAAKGVGEAFRVVKKLYSADPLFAAECHSFVHLLGNAAAARFLKEGTPSIPPETAFCSYGFYHGFMEAVLQANGNASDARRFCDSVGKSLEGGAPGARNACFHGIGHGITDPHDNRAWGDAKALIAPALATCDTISSTPLETYLCSTGVFNALEIMMTSGQRGLSPTKDPFQICRSQPQRFASACYTNMVPAVLVSTANRLPESGALIATIAEDRYAENAMQAFGAEMIRLYLGGGSPAPETYLPSCRALEPRLRLPCVQGLLVGLMKYGRPGEEYKEAFRFCRAAGLRPDERDRCFTELLGNEIRVYYSQAKAKEICGTLDESLQPYCKRSVPPPF